MPSVLGGGAAREPEGKVLARGQVPLRESEACLCPATCAAPTCQHRPGWWPGQLPQRRGRAGAGWHCPQKLTVHILSQLYSQASPVGSLKLATVGALTPPKSARATEQGCPRPPPCYKRLPARLQRAEPGCRSERKQADPVQVPLCQRASRFCAFPPPPAPDLPYVHLIVST